MERIVKLVLAVLLSCLVSCSKTDEQKALALVEDYLERTADDPSSVQDIEVGSLITDDKVEHDLHGNKIRYKFASVSYRAKNAYGALVLVDGVVVKFDEGVTKIVCFNCFGGSY